ncbi:hypothetical protein ACQJBY_005556 [Aegilops geniculata]
MRNQDLDKAVMEFKTALELAESIGDRFEEKKAARGLGASLQRLGQYREAMSWYYKVLALSKETGEDSGCTEAYGAIADCCADLGYLEGGLELLLTAGAPRTRREDQHSSGSACFFPGRRCSAEEAYTVAVPRGSEGGAPAVDKRGG